MMCNRFKMKEPRFRMAVIIITHNHESVRSWGKIIQRG